MLAVLIYIITEVARKYRGEPWFPLNDLAVHGPKRIRARGLPLLNLQSKLFFLGLLWYAQYSGVFSFIVLGELLVVLVDPERWIWMLCVIYHHLWPGLRFYLLLNQRSFPKLESGFVISEDWGARNTHAHKWWLFERLLLILIGDSQLLRTFLFNSGKFIIMTRYRKRNIHLVYIVLGHLKIWVVDVLDTCVWPLSC